MVSACLLGVSCRYHQRSAYDQRVVDWARKTGAIPICPEIFGGMPRPMPATEIVGGTGEDVLCYNAKVLDQAGIDYTALSIRGAEEVYRLGCVLGAVGAVLRTPSPSCGVGLTYSGSFDGKLIPENGVVAAFLKAKGMEVRSDKDLPQETASELGEQILQKLTQGRGDKS